MPVCPGRFARRTDRQSRLRRTKSTTLNKSQRKIQGKGGWVSSKKENGKDLETCKGKDVSCPSSLVGGKRSRISKTVDSSEKTAVVRERGKSQDPHIKTADPRPQTPEPEEENSR